jgi:hypothetical protein
MGMPGSPLRDPSDDPGEVSGPSLAGYLLDSALEHEEVPVAEDLRTALALDDVIDDAERFGAQYRYATEHNLPLPLLRAVDGEGYLMPVNADSTFFPQGAPADPGEVSEALEAVRRQPQPENAPRFIDLGPPDAVASSFRSRLGDFLTLRLRGAAASRAAQESGDEVLRTDTTAALVTASGLLFEVHTVTHGLRVYFHPAYWHNSTTVFGNRLSTPVPGYLKPGRYVFGATGSALPLQFDPAEYDVPGTSRADLYW